MDLATTISDFDEVLSGNCDDIPEAAFYMVGVLADVKEKAASLAAATAKCDLKSLSRKLRLRWFVCRLVLAW